MEIIKKSQQLIKMINESSNIFLMAHKDLDLDAINSCLGIHYYLKNNNKKSYIIIDDRKLELGVKKVIDNYCPKNITIRSNKVEDIKDENSLLIVLDTNKFKLLQNQELIYSFHKVINIDHHDKSDDTISSNLSIIDTKASSTCEMIANFLRHNEVKVTSKLATLLLAGIILDTNYYYQKTDPDTFYISYYLTKCGGKVKDVNELLKQNIKDYIKRQKIISSVKLINNVAIGKGLQRSLYKKEEIAKTADSLLTFNKIEASFVVAKVEKDLISISGRATGSINIGKILESFGGGGNEYEGAAKIENSSINKVFEELLQIIKNV